MAEGKESKKDSSKKGIPFIAKVLIVAIVLILIVVISVGSAFFIASKVNKTSGDGSNTIEKTVKEENTEETAYGTTVDFGEYTVNLREEEPRYLVLRINFELDPELKAKKVTKIQTSITEKKVILEDKMLTILRNKSIEDLSTDKDLVELKKQLTAEANKVLGEESVKTIRFNSWLIQ
ncbi:MAG: flagellar basal body-associated FliL family protein [Fusobacteriaceae bacterium]|nr:flagellar basal body-associated FliL family protein [Fusobacteriaceae bacterium]MBN2839111.1 flagellar basal body-associated FliL family protein [Fusobacteriaceae bacterium]